LDCRLAGFVFATIFMAGSASAQVSVCVNAAGKKEYAQTCPPGTVKQKELAGSSAAKSETSADSGDSQKSANQLELEFQQRRIAREQSEDKQEQERKAEKNKCDYLKQRLDMYENSRGIRKQDPVTGKWAVVEDAQRPAIMAQIRNDMRQCR